MEKDERLINTLNSSRHKVNDDNSKRIITIVDKRKKPVEFHNKKKKLFDDELIEKLNRERKNVKCNLKECEEENKPIKLDNLNSVLEGSKKVLKKVEEKFDKPVHEDRQDVLKDIANTLKEISKQLDSIKGLLIEK